MGWIFCLSQERSADVLPVADVDDVLMMITSGIMVAFMVVYFAVASDAGIEIVSLNLER